MENEQKQTEKFTSQDKASFIRYGATLSRIHNRLVIEGYFEKDGKTWDIFKVGTIIGCFEIED